MFAQSFVANKDTKLCSQTFHDICVVNVNVSTRRRRDWLTDVELRPAITQERGFVVSVGGDISGGDASLFHL